MARIIPQPRVWQGLGAAAWLFCILIFTTSTAVGSTPPLCEPAVLTLIEAAELLRIDADTMEQLAERQEVPARRIGASWRFNCAALMAWLNGDWELIVAEVAPRSADSAPLVRPDAQPPVVQPSLTAQELTEMIAAGTATDQAETAPATRVRPPADIREQTIGEAPEEQTAEDILLRDQRLLLSPGDVTLNFGQFYSDGERHSFASIDGEVVLATVEQDALITTLQGRVGVGDETELFASTSYFSQDSNVFTGSQQLGSSSRSEFDDVRFGVRHTLLKEGAGRPNIIATITGYIPTGDTSYAIGGGLAFTKSIDPVALFASVNNKHTFSEDFADVTRLEPENRLDASFGYALALNDTLSLSTSVSAIFTGATSFSSVELRRQDSYSLGFGLTSWLANGLYIEPSLSVSIGGPDDSLSFGISLFTIRR